MKTSKKVLRSGTPRRTVAAAHQDAVIRVSKRQYDEMITADSSSQVESVLVAFLRERNAPAK